MPECFYVKKLVL